MANFIIDNFAGGVDRRRHELAAPPGTLRELTNAHITPGGGIEKRPRFTKMFNLAGTFGLVSNSSYSNAKLYFFGYLDSHWNDGNVYTDYQGREITLVYVKLEGYDNSNLNRVAAWDVFDGEPYAVLREDNTGTPEHYYKGVRVPTPRDIDTIRVHKGKVYGGNNQRLSFTAALDPTDWTTEADGAGFIDIDTVEGAAGNIVNMRPYYNHLAVFTRTSVQVWSMDADPVNNSLAQVIPGASTRCHYSPTPFGNNDILFVSSSGVRSLRSRDSSNAAAVSDVGSPIDAIYQSRGRENRLSTYVNAIVEPAEHRYWVWHRGYGDGSDEFGTSQMDVLGAFPGAGVTAWSRYETIDALGEEFQYKHRDVAILASQSNVFLRAEDDWVYIFEPNGYDFTEATAVTPYLDMNDPVAFKSFKGLDVLCVGDWTVEASFDPDNVVWDTVGTLTRSTFGMGRIALQGHAPHIALRFRSTWRGPARIERIAVHFDTADAG